MPNDNRILLFALLLLALFSAGCMNKIPVVAHYQKKATETCELKHTPEECKPVTYPSCTQGEFRKACQ